MLYALNNLPFWNDGKKMTAQVLVAFQLNKKIVSCLVKHFPLAVRWFPDLVLSRFAVYKLQLDLFSICLTLYGQSRQLICPRCRLQWISHRLQRRDLALGQEQGRQVRNQVHVRLPRWDERHPQQGERNQVDRLVATLQPLSTESQPYFIPLLPPSSPHPLAGTAASIYLAF